VDFAGVDAADFETAAGFGADFGAGFGAGFGDGRGIDVFCATGEALADAEPLNAAEAAALEITADAPALDGDADDTDVSSGEAAVHALERATAAAKRIDPRRNTNPRNTNLRNTKPHCALS
jgi:hypothetical protein